MNKQKMSKIFPLSPLERALRYGYRTGYSAGDSDLFAKLSSEPESLQILQHFLDSIGNDELKEDAFFDDTCDVFISRHVRYLPPILHSHYFFEVQFVLDGVVKQRIGEAEVDLHPGDICFIAPDTSHMLEANRDDVLLFNLLLRRDTFRMNFNTLISKNDVIADFFNLILFRDQYRPYLLCRAGKDEWLQDILLKMMLNRDSGNSFNNRLQCILTEEFFIYLLQRHENDFIISSETLGQNQEFMHILRYIRDHFRTTSLTAVAKHFGYNPAHLSRRIKFYTGLTYTELIQRIKLEYAATLLLSSANSVSEIIADIGYDDKSYFYRTFRKKYGVTPAEYRANARARSL